MTLYDFVRLWMILSATEKALEVVRRLEGSHRRSIEALEKEQDEQVGWCVPPTISAVLSLKGLDR